MIGFGRFESSSSFSSSSSSSSLLSSSKLAPSENGSKSKWDGKMEGGPIIFFLWFSLFHGLYYKVGGNLGRISRRIPFSAVFSAVFSAGRGNRSRTPGVSFSGFVEHPRVPRNKMPLSIRISNGQFNQ